MSISDTLITISIGLISTIIGYCIKIIIDALKNKYLKQKELLNNLRILQLKLTDAREMFNLQKEKRDALDAMLKENHKQEIESGIAKGYVGYNDLFKKLYPIFTEREKELFMVIRGLSESLKVINMEVRDWLGKDYLLNIQDDKTEEVTKLEEKFEELRKHLNGWFAIYMGLFLNDKRYALVYTADEWEYAKKFPKDLEDELDKVIKSERIGKLR